MSTKAPIHTVPLHLENEGLLHYYIDARGSGNLAKQAGHDGSHGGEQQQHTQANINFCHTMVLSWCRIVILSWATINQIILIESVVCVPDTGIQVPCIYWNGAGKDGPC